jgi:hypothetical protein
MIYPQLHHEVVGEAMVVVEANVDVKARVDGTAREVMEILSLNSILRIVVIVLLLGELLDQQE